MLKFLLMLIAIGGVAIAGEIIIDNTQPVVAISTPTTASPSYNVSGEAVPVIFNYTEANPSNYTITIYNSTAVICSRLNTSGLAGGVNVTVYESCTVGTVSDGWYNLTINMTDLVGNKSSNTQIDALKIDSVLPVISSPNPANNSVVASSPITLSIATDETAECRYSQSSGKSFASMTSFANTNSTSHSSVLNLLDYGMYNFYFKCRDLRGNTYTSDYWITFTYSRAFAVYGRTATMNLAYHIGSSKSDDSILYSSNYISAEDNGDVLGLVSSGGNTFGTNYNSSYSSGDYIISMDQSLEGNRFLIVLTNGTSSNIRDKMNMLGGKKILPKAFGFLSYAVPDGFPLFLKLHYDDVDITTKARWVAGAREIMIKNEGKNGQGVPKISIRVIK